MFFSLDESAGFAVAGGAALIARALVDRSTQDVDLFSGAPPVVPIPDVVRAFTRAAVAEGWLVRQLRLSDSFARLAVEADGEVTVVDLGPRPPAPGRRRATRPRADSSQLGIRLAVAVAPRSQQASRAAASASPITVSGPRGRASVVPRDAARLSVIHVAR